MPLDGFMVTPIRYNNKETRAVLAVLAVSLNRQFSTKHIHGVGLACHNILSRPRIGDQNLEQFNHHFPSYPPVAKSQD